MHESIGRCAHVYQCRGRKEERHHLLSAPSFSVEQELGTGVSLADQRLLENNTSYQENKNVGTGQSWGKKEKWRVGKSEIRGRSYRSRVDCMRE
jgi:hypothetical protein